jgi:SAM-dependent methyltransferase
VNLRLSTPQFLAVPGQAKTEGPARDSLGAMLAWHELVERDHDLQNPTSPEKIVLAGSYLRLGPETTVLDVACGKAGPALLLAREFGCRIHGIDISPVFVAEAHRRITAAGLERLVTVEAGDAAQMSERPSCDAALCIGAAFIWGHIGDAAAVLARTVGSGGSIAVGEPFWRTTGRVEDEFVDLAQTVMRFESAGVDLTAIVASAEDDWDRYQSLQWRVAVETGGNEVMSTHLDRREHHLKRRSELGWAIFTGRVR